MISSLAGLLLILALGWYFEGYFTRLYTAKSALVVEHYGWMMPFAMGMLLFSVLEGFNWALGKSVLSNFLKETLLRILTFFLIVSFYLGWINYRQFIHLFSLQFLIIFLVLLVYLIREKKIHFSFSLCFRA
jgi:hypothetical protein